MDRLATPVVELVAQRRADAHPLAHRRRNPPLGPASLVLLPFPLPAGLPAPCSPRLGIVVGGKIRSAPTLHSKLIGRGRIEGRFTDEEAAAIAKTLMKLQGPLRVVEVR